jgi:hypothetical protein
MKRNSAVALTLVLAAAACLQPREASDGADEARSALPTAENLTVAVPGQSGGSQKVGDVASTYVLTRTVATELNGGTAVILGLVKTITDYPATSASNGTFVWGPFYETLKPGEYKLTVHLNNQGDFEWSIDGRVRATGGAFMTIVSGVATPGRPHRGSGSFTFDCDVAHAIDPFGGCDDGGQLSATYDLEHSPATLVIDAQHLAPQANGPDAEETFHYSYSLAADGSGALTFTSFADTDDPGNQWETVTYLSRWKSTGAGRTDVSITGGDLSTSVVTSEECWDTTFKRTYFTVSAEWEPTEGNPAACAF